MDPNTDYSGTTPPEPDSGQTRSFPPQEGYRAQEAAQQPANPQQPVNQPNAAPFSWPTNRRERDRTILALLLIGGGILFLLDLFPFFPGFDDMLLLVLGGIFLYAYYNTRPGYRIGFLIPGAILLGLGVGQVLTSLNFRIWGEGGDIHAVTLGLGFCLIWLLERKHWWALIPGGVLILSGLSSAVGVGMGSLWPVVLIIIGVYILYDRSRHHPVR